MSLVELQAVQAHLVYKSSDFTAVAGVARGDDLSVSDDLVLDDVYQLRPPPNARSLPSALSVKTDPIRSSTTARLAVGGTIYSSTPASP